MPKPGEEVNKPEDDVLDPTVGQDDEAEEDEDEDLTVDIGDDDSSEDDDKEERNRNKAFAAMRIQNKELKDTVNSLKETVDSLKKPAMPDMPRPQQSDIEPGVPQTDEEWDALAEKDWKKAVDLRSIQNARQIVETQTKTAKASSVLDQSKQKVLGVHPELNDAASEKSKIFTRILDENPDYLTQPRGPLYAMRDMEDYMENTLGYKRNEIRTAEKKGASREASRQHRIILNSGDGRTPPKSSNQVVLTKEQLEFCKFQGLDPKEYARNLKKLSKSGTTEGVSV